MLKKTLVTGAAVLALSFSLTACSTGSDAANPPAASSSSSPAASATKDARTGTFEGLNDKKVSGTVTIADGKLKLEGFSSDEGPDLHIYLANGTDEATVTAGKEIAGVVWNSATQSLDLNGADTTGYTYVVVHCDKAKAVFGAAKLA